MVALSLAGSKAGYEAYKSMMSSGLALEGSQAKVHSLCSTLHTVYVIVSELFYQTYQGFVSKGPSPERTQVQGDLESKETSRSEQLRPWKPRQAVRESYAKGQCRCIQENLCITKDLVGKVVIWHMTQFKSCLNLAFELDFSHIPWNSSSHQLFTVLVWQ